MPRPKVPPSQRQRAPEACNSCREAKKRCSGTAPCTHCLRRGMGDSCFISNQPRGRRRSSTAATIASSSSRVGPGSGTTRATVASPTRGALQSPAPLGPSGHSPSLSINVVPASGTADFRPLSPSDSRTTDLGASSVPRSVGEQPRHRPEPSGDTLLSVKPSSRMLLNLRGERVYIGGGGSLSFLQLVRSIVSEQIGPSQFSHNGRSDTMLEKQSPQSHAHTPTVADLSPEARLMCADYFYAATGGLIDVFLPQELEMLLTSLSSASQQKRSLADLVIAVGLQCEPSADTHDREMAYFRGSQSRTFSGMLEDPDIDMVRIFLIMSFYLLGECRRNTAFLYMGIATRAAVALGLHSRETYIDMSDKKHQLRLRVWMSLRVLDIVISSILGRPAATAGIHCDLQPLIDNVLATSQDRGLICLGASYRLVALINKIIDKMYDRKEITVPAVEEHLQQLERWSQALPEFLRAPPSTAGGTDASAEKGAVGSVHVSCLYYFAVTLVTRPILVSTLTQQSASNLVHTQLATACLDAAMFIVQTCTGAQKLNLIQANMCILMAIVFPAGLVLGFEVFAKSTVDYGVEAAFQGARDILQFWGAKCPQATLYHDILTSLSNAIREYRQRAVAKGKSPYVSKIFAFDRSQIETSDPGSDRQGGAGPATVDDGQRTQMDDILASWSFGQNTPVGSGEMFFDWDTLDISQWNSFPYVA